MSNIVKLILACAVNFVLFIVIPALHGLFGTAFTNRDNSAYQKRVVAEIIQPKKEEKKTFRQHIRQVRTAQARSSAGDMQMKFIPDLDVAAGDGIAMAQQNLEAVIFEEGETDEDPVPVRTPPIPYPDRARDLGIEGVLQIEIVIGLDGRVESVEIVKSPHPSISSAARRTVSQWRFKPAKNSGIPVRIRAGKEIEFKLD